MNRIYITYEQARAYGRVLRLLRDFCPEFTFICHRDGEGGFYYELWMREESD